MVGEWFAAEVRVASASLDSRVASLRLRTRAAI